MKSTVYYLVFNLILFGIVTALQSILDKEEIGDGDSFKVVCDVTYITTAIIDPETEDMCIINTSPVGSLNYIILYDSSAPPEIYRVPPGRTFIFKRNVNPGEHKHISVEVKDARCSDAGIYYCLCRGSAIFRVNATLREKASCYPRTTTTTTTTVETSTPMKLTEKVTSATHRSSKKGTGMSTTRRTPKNAGMEAGSPDKLHLIVWSVLVCSVKFVFH